MLTNLNLGAADIVEKLSTMGHDVNPRTVNGVRSGTIMTVEVIKTLLSTMKGNTREQFLKNLTG